MGTSKFVEKIDKIVNEIYDKLYGKDITIDKAIKTIKKVFKENNYELEIINNKEIKECEKLHIEYFYGMNEIHPIKIKDKDNNKEYNAYILIYNSLEDKNKIKQIWLIIMDKCNEIYSDGLYESD